LNRYRYEPKTECLFYGSLLTAVLLGTVTAWPTQSRAENGLPVAAGSPINSVVATISVTGRPFSIAVSPDSAHVYVAQTQAGTIAKIDAANASPEMDMISTMTDKPVGGPILLSTATETTGIFGVAVGA
jgi:hypothetical protein